MTDVSYTDLRKDLASYLDEALDSHAPITVTRQGKGDVVMLSAKEFAGLQETIHLLRSPANAQHLLRSIKSAKVGLVSERALTTKDAATA